MKSSTQFFQMFIHHPSNFYGFHPLPTTESFIRGRFQPGRQEVAFCSSSPAPLFVSLLSSRVTSAPSTKNRFAGHSFRYREPRSFFSSRTPCPVSNALCSSICRSVTRSLPLFLVSLSPGVTTIAMFAEIFPFPSFFCIKRHHYIWYAFCKPSFDCLRVIDLVERLRVTDEIIALYEEALAVVLGVWLWGRFLGFLGNRYGLGDPEL